MVKFGKNKFKALNKVAKSNKLVAVSPGVSNKILKKKINAEKKVTFQKEVLQSVISGNDALVKNITACRLRDKSGNHLTKVQKDKAADQSKADQTKVSKLKPVEKKKKRRKTQIDDTKLMRSLMKKQNTM